MGVALGQVEARGPLQNEAVGLDDPSRQSLPAFSRRGLARPHYAATSAGVKKKANGAPGFCFFLSSVPSFRVGIGMGLARLGTLSLAAGS